MNAHEQERMAKLLKKSLPPIAGVDAAEDAAENAAENAAQLGRDLWPAMLHRLQAPPSAVRWFNQAWFNQAWFDWALLGAAAIWLAFFPAAIPVLLYHL